MKETLELVEKFAPRLFGVTDATPKMIKNTEICVLYAMAELFKKQPEDKQLELIKFQAELHGIR